MSKKLIRHNTGFDRNRRDFRQGSEIEEDIRQFAQGHIWYVNNKTSDCDCNHAIQCCGKQDDKSLKQCCRPCGIER